MYYTLGRRGGQAEAEKARDRCSEIGEPLSVLTVVYNRIMRGSKPKGRTREARLRALETEYRKLAAQLAAIGPLHDGSVLRQMLTCGKSNCACHQDASRRHGPYAYWTTKVAGKTVSKRLTDAEADLYETWIGNRRKLEETRKRMITLSRKMLPLVLAIRASTR